MPRPHPPTQKKNEIYFNDKHLTRKTYLNDNNWSEKERDIKAKNFG